MIAGALAPHCLTADHRKMGSVENWSPPRLRKFRFSAISSRHMAPLVTDIEGRCKFFYLQPSRPTSD